MRTTQTNNRRDSQPSAYPHTQPPTYSLRAIQYSLHLHRTSGSPRMCDIDLWVTDHLISSSEGTWFHKIRLCCQTVVLPAPNGQLTKPTHRGEAAILFAGQHYPPQKTAQTKATWWRGKPWQLYLIPLRHSRGTNINHCPPAPDPSSPLDAICHRTVGADMVLKIQSNLPI